MNWPSMADESSLTAVSLTMNRAQSGPMREAPEPTIRLWWMAKSSQKFGESFEWRVERSLSGLSAKNRRMDRLCSREPTTGTQDWQASLFIKGRCHMMGRGFG